MLEPFRVPTEEEFKRRWLPVIQKGMSELKGRRRFGIEFKSQMGRRYPTSDDLVRIVELAVTNGIPVNRIHLECRECVFKRMHPDDSCVLDFLMLEFDKPLS